MERLAHEIWHEHYPGILSREQIDYMLARDYGAAALAGDLRRGVTVLGWWRDGELAGFSAHGPHDEGVKIHKLYVHAAARRRGGARALVAEIERDARGAGAGALVLQVNRRNTAAIAAYEALGFARRRDLIVDIGGGFVMDDHWMVRPL